MTQPLLSILIPTVVGREEQVDALLKKIRNKKAWNEVKQIKDKYETHLGECFDTPVCFQVYKDDKTLTIGEKREDMYKDSMGLFSWQIDDDDDISDNAIELILEAIKSNPEVPCITFKERCMINGEYKSSNHSIRYSQWMDNQDGYDYVRCPFYKDVIRTDLAKQTPFEHIRWNEDEKFSYAIKHLLTDEIHIEEELYHYIYNETNHEERYGFDRD